MTKGVNQKTLEKRGQQKTKLKAQQKMTSYNIRTQPLEIMKEELKNSDNDNFLILI